MGPSESPTARPENQEARRKRLARRPRARRCLLKGCEQHTLSPAGAPALLQRALPGGGAEVVALEGAATIPGETAAGQQKRNGQSRRYRERVKSRNPPEPEAVNDHARVVTTEHFFRSLLRPARLLRGIRAPAAKSLTMLLLTRLPARAGARPRTRAALETGA
jgi:hypothetical protein